MGFDLSQGGRWWQDGLKESALTDRVLGRVRPCQESALFRMISGDVTHDEFEGAPRQWVTPSSEEEPAQPVRSAEQARSPATSSMSKGTRPYSASSRSLAVPVACARAWGSSSSRSVSVSSRAMPSPRSRRYQS